MTEQEVQTDWAMVGVFVLLALALAIAVGLLFPPASAANYYVNQGDVVYINDTVDISGILAGVQNLAWYGGYDEEGNQFLVNLSYTKEGYYNYYIDPAIFNGRLGKWYKWNGKLESNGNTLAFIVRPERKGTDLLSQTSNITVVETPTIVYANPPLLPVRHVSDYLVARGDGFSIPINGPTNVWIFGTREHVYDHHSVNDTLEIKSEVIDTLSPGRYTLLLQTHKADTTQGFFVRYNEEMQTIDWFDPVTFKVTQFDTIGKTPDVVLKKLEEIFPTTNDQFVKFNLEVEDPTISIARIDATNALSGYDPDATISLERYSYLDVRGYTNAAPDTIIKVKVDPNFNLSDEWKDAIATKAEGEIGGDMREWKVLVPIEKYNMAMGRHFVGAVAAIGNAVTTADFYIYGNPENSFVPNKTMRYISGRYGDQEIIPTPTPKVVEVPVTVTVTVTVLTTPPPEEVEAAQRVVAEEQRKITDEKNKQLGIMVGVLIAGVLVPFVVFRFIYRSYKRRMWLNK